MKRISVLLIFIISFLYACEKKTETPAPEPEPQPVEDPVIQLVFSNTFDGAPLVLGTTYTNANGDPVKISKFSYYVSNIRLVKSDNSLHAVPESYFIVKATSAASQTISLRVPPATYKGVQFLLGVDSARNTSGAQTGGLDVVYASDMYWSWSTGYIFMKLEGSSDSCGNTSKQFEFHVGGFRGQNKGLRWIDVNMPATIVHHTQRPAFVIKADVNEVFRSPALVDLKTDYSVLSAGTKSKMIADNYADMFTFDKIVF